MRSRNVLAPRPASPSPRSGPVAAVLAVLALLSAACGGATDPGDSSPETTVPSAASSIDGAWVLLSATVDGETLTPIGGYPVTMEIVDGRVSGSAGCNSYGGEVRLDGSSFAVAELFITEMACVDDRPMLVEAGFMAALGRATSIEATADGLVLAGDEVSMSFDAVQPAPTSN